MLVFDDDLHVEGDHVGELDAEGRDASDAAGESALRVGVDADLDLLFGFDLSDLCLVDGADDAKVREVREGG